MRIVIAGAGISGLATAFALLEKRPDLDTRIYESADRVGGKIRTERSKEGYLLEWGVNAFLNNKPKTLELAGRVGLEPLVSYDASRKRYIFSEGVLHRLPESPPSFFLSNFLSLKGRLRILGELYVPRGTKEDETLAEFATRRLGREAYEKMIDPMASGVYAGNAELLSLKSCFPRIHEIESTYGSLIRGLIRLQVEAKKQRKKEMPSAAPSGKLTTFSSGMGALTDALTGALGARVETGKGVVSLSRKGKGYDVHLSDGTTTEADRVVLAVPAYVQAGILRELAPEISTVMSKIPYPALSICSLGYRRGKVTHDLDGFGFLVPSRERRRILGTLWDTSIFPNRAPAGHVLLRSMVGGARASDIAMLPDEKIVDLVRADLKDIMGFDADPDFARVFRHEKAIPQYHVGHEAGLKTIDEALTKLPGLHLTGNALRGVALNDCITNAYLLAERMFS